MRCGEFFISLFTKTVFLDTLSLIYNGEVNILGAMRDAWMCFDDCRGASTYSTGLKSEMTDHQ